MLPQPLYLPPHLDGVFVSYLLIAVYMQNPPLHSSSAPPIHTPVTRLIAALKEADTTEDDKLSRRQMLSGVLGFLVALLGLSLFAIYEHYWKEEWLVWASMAALGGGTAWSVVFTVFGGREILQMLKASKSMR